MFTDDAPIWTDGVFPVRVPVQVVLEVPLAAAVPIKSLSLSFLPQGQAATAWTVHVRSAPRPWREADGEAVHRALVARQAAQALDDNTAPSLPVVTGRRTPRRGTLPVTTRVGRIVARTDQLALDEPLETVGSYETVLAVNKVTGHSVNVPIGATCRPSATCLHYCYFAAGAPSWSNALRHQRRVFATIQADPSGFAERVALEYDSLGLTFIRWNGGGDLFAESVTAINHLARMRPDIPIWVVTRLPEWASQIDDRPNVFVHFSLDRHSLGRREEFRASAPRTQNYFFSYQCGPGELPDPATLAQAGVAVTFFNDYHPSGDLSVYPPAIICPLNRADDIRGTCGSCRRCFDGSAVAWRRDGGEPVETAITDTVRAFKEIPLGAR